MKRKFIQVFLKILLLIFLITIIVNIINISEATVNLNNFTGGDSTGSEGVQTALGKILGIVQVIAVGTATIMLVVLGIKYLVSSVSERAEIKKHFTIYVLGALLIFGASGIVQLIKNFTGEMGGK